MKGADDLRRQIEESFSTKQRAVEAETFSIRLTCPAGMDDLLDELASRPNTDADVADERLPYWAELWPSSIALATHLACRENDLKGVRTVELGCGLGLAGIAAGLRGAEVLLTDYMPAALDFAALNWWDNVGTAPAVQRLDWRKPDPALQATLLLAADIVYEKRAFEPVLIALRQLLAPDGQILLAEPRRRLALEFFDGLEKAGFRVGNRFECAQAIDIYELRRT